MKQVRNVEVETIVCSRPPKAKANGWSFPKSIEDLLRRELAGKSVLHLFGGMARFGTRLDVDPATRPDVIGDAWMPPFARSSFDVVILDPPYVRFSGQMTMALCCQAAWVAREQVIWFHTLWLDHSEKDGSTKDACYNPNGDGSIDYLNPGEGCALGFSIATDREAPKPSEEKI